MSPAGSRVSRRGWWGVLAAAILGLQLALPGAVLASQTWTAMADQSSVSMGVSTTVLITVTNTSSSGGSNAHIGCVRVQVPVGFVVTATAVSYVTPGHAWSVSSSGPGPTTVTASAAANADRLSGDPDYEQVVIAITVTGVVPGSYSWTADEFNRRNCLAAFNQPVNMPMAIVLLPTPTPAPSPTDPPDPTPAPTPKPTPSPTPAPTPKSTPAPTAPDATPTATHGGLPSQTPGPTPGVTPGPSPSEIPTAAPASDAPGPPSGSPSTTPGGGSGGELPPGSNVGGRDVFRVPGDPASLPVDVAGVELASAVLGGFGAVVWLVPGLALSVPGLVVILTVLAQLAGGLAWLPLVRRKIGAFGLRHEGPGQNR